MAGAWHRINPKADSKESLRSATSVLFNSVHETALTAFRMGLPTSNHSSKKIPHSCVKASLTQTGEPNSDRSVVRLLSQVTPDCVKLTAEAPIQNRKKHSTLGHSLHPCWMFQTDVNTTLKPWRHLRRSVLPRPCINDRDQEWFYPSGLEEPWSLIWGIYKSTGKSWEATAKEMSIS